MFWVDLLTKEEFEAGFGSHTPMYTGQTKCVRYYMNLPRGLDLFRQVALKVLHLLRSACPFSVLTRVCLLMCACAVHLCHVAS